MLKTRMAIHVVDAHTEGEPIRIVTAGIPKVPGATIIDRMHYFAAHYDGIRSFLMKEPRGHKDMFGAIIVPPASDDGDFGVLFCHNEGMSTMCGHGTIGTVKALAETGFLRLHEGENIVRIDAPAGRVKARAIVRGGDVASVSFINVPSFVYADSVKIPLEGFGEVEAAIAYAGTFYIMVEEKKIGVNVCPEQAGVIKERAMALKDWVNANMKVAHPENPDVNGIYGVAVMSPEGKTQCGFKGRQAIVFADGALDRSPCGTGTSARMALMHSRGQMRLGDTFCASSIINTKFTGTITDEVKAAGKDAIIPEIAGSAWITGFSEFLLEDSDPLPEGFLLQGE